MCERTRAGRSKTRADVHESLPEKVCTASKSLRNFEEQERQRAYEEARRIVKR